MNPPPKTVADLYAEWWTLVKPEDLAENQTEEMRRAFYSGFHVALNSCINLGDLPLEDACKTLDSQTAETSAFFSALAKEQIL